ncbi:MAG: zinc ribbon domain-containing protein [Bacteroidaceae bacterium]|nr:zinc ribbon domain-containing protein [Bacteroidaceae bacterium]
MDKKVRTFAMWLLLLPLLAACTHGTAESNSLCDSDTVAVTVITADEVAVPTDTVTALSVQQIDSLRFRLTHHYNENFNFRVKSDSLCLVPRLGDTVTDTCWVFDDDLIVVAQIYTQLAQDSLARDTVWVKVARDQQTMGWVEEQQLLQSSVPDDPISQILDALTYSRGVWMTLLILLGIVGLSVGGKRMRNSIPSPYPFLLLMLVGLIATLYASVQNFAPEYWLEYYFHPTMNPLLLPPVMAVLVTLIWTLLIVTGAVVIEVYRYLNFLRGMVYLFQLAGLSMVVYLVISWTTLIYVGYLLLPLFILTLIYIYRHWIRCTLQCGNCGRPLRQKGICPACGAVNE